MTSETSLTGLLEAAILPLELRQSSQTRAEAAFLLFINEETMAKRRNLKKEKAQRNQAYARKFRKRQNTGRFFKKFRQGKPPKREDEEEDQMAAT